MILVDGGGRILEANPTALRLLGPLTVGHLLWDAHPAFFGSALQVGIERGQAVPHSCSTGRENQDHACLAVSSQAVGNGWLVVIDDDTGVSCRLGRQQRVAWTLRIYEETASLARICGWEIDYLTGRVTYDHHLVTLLGLPSDRPLTLEDMRAFLNPDDRARIQALSRSVQGRTRFEQDVRADRPDGSERWLRITGHAEHVDGRPVRIWGTAQDVTERTHDDLALREAFERAAGVERLFNTAGVGLCTLDTAGRFLTLSDEWTRMLGCSRGELLGTSVQDRLHADDRAVFARAINRLLAGDPSPPQPEVRCLTPEGEEIWLSWRLTQAAGRIQAAAFDITARRLQEEERERLREEALTLARAAEQASVAKSAFLATMSHEIRTPMNGVLGMAQLLQASDLGTQQAELVNRLIGSGEALMRLLDDILDVSRAESGRLELENAPFEPQKVVEEMVATLRPLATRKDVGLVFDPGPPLPKLRGDAGRFRQILNNLTGNALKFTLEGSVTVRLAYDMSRQRLRLSVSDTGIGMSDEEQSRVFEPFSQADPSTTRRFGGTGLGLTICRQLATAMDGTLAVESRPGQGSTFVLDVALPVCVECMTTPTPKPKPPPRVQSARVLLVEDNAVNQQVATLMLRRIGCVVQVAADGAQGVAAFQQGSFDLILMDWHMPVMDGLAASREIRLLERGTGSHIPIIALTASTMPGDADTCRRAGMDDFLSKPLRWQSLSEAVVRWTTSKEELAQPIAAASGGG